MKPRKITEISKEEREEDEEEEEEYVKEESTEEQISDEISSENSDKEEADVIREDKEIKNANADGVEGANVSGGDKPRSIMETFNDYLESIFSTEEEQDEEVSLLNHAFMHRV